MPGPKAPLVSVILPAYKHESFVRPAIESVLAQSLDDWELIVIDDNSPDQTWRVLQGFSDERIALSKHDATLGANATLNEGLGRARGKYLAILNSDDLYHPNRLRRAVEAIETQELDFLGTDIDLIDENGKVIESGHPWLEWFAKRIESLKETGSVPNALLAGNLFVTTSNFFFTRGVLRRVGQFADLRYAHDYDFLLRAAFGTRIRIGFLEGEKLLSYRMHGQNTVLESFLDVNRETFLLLCRLVPQAFRQNARKRAQVAVGYLRDLEANIEYDIYKEVARKDQQIQSIEAGFVTAEADKRQLVSELARKGEEVESLVADLARREEELRDLSEDAARREETLKSLGVDLARRESEVKSLVADLDQRKDEIRCLAGAVDQRERQIHDLAAELASKGAYIDALTSSRSWRMTAPLRAAARGLRSLGRAQRGHS